MNKNIIIGVVSLLFIAGAVYFWVSREDIEDQVGATINIDETPNDVLENEGVFGGFFRSDLTEEERAKTLEIVSEIKNIEEEAIISLEKNFASEDGDILSVFKQLNADMERVKDRLSEYVAEEKREEFNNLWKESLRQLESGYIIK